MFKGATVAVGAVPVPFRVTDCGLVAALSLTWRVALRAPVPVGLNVTLITHDPFVAGTTEPFVQVVVPATIAKSPGFAPVMVTALAAANVTDAAPLLFNVTVILALVVLMGWLLNGTGEGDSDTFAAVPV